MKVYLAALYSRMEEMRGYAEFLKTEGFEITSTWIYGSEENVERELAALTDLADLDEADIVLSFTHQKGTLTKGGGRHVEFGYSYAKGKKLIIIGERENVFHHLPNVEVYPDLGSWFYGK
jgi:nucleoside 2-deoxyribosyltransferase